MKKLILMILLSGCSVELCYRQGQKLCDGPLIKECIPFSMYERQTMKKNCINNCIQVRNNCLANNDCEKVCEKEHSKFIGYWTSRTDCAYNYMTCEESSITNPNPEEAYCSPINDT